MTTRELIVSLELVSCCSCHAVFGLEQQAHRTYKENHHFFYCPYCKADLFFRGKSKTEELRDELNSAHTCLVRERASHDQTRADRDTERRRSASYKGHLSRTKKRIGKGVCPCCNRYFANVHKHMANKHPTYDHAKAGWD